MNRMEPMQKEFECVCKLGQELVHSAAPGVDTADLERDLEAVSNGWIGLNDNVRKIFNFSS